MMDFHKYFHWFYYHKGKASLFNFGLGGFIWLFLAITQPFGIYDNNVSGLLLVLLLLPIGLLWVVFSFGLDWLGKNILGLPLKENHSLDGWAWVIKIALAVQVTFALRGTLCNWQCVDGWEYLQQWLAFVLMFGFFYLPYTFYAKYQFYHGMVGDDGSGEFQMTLTGEGKEVLKMDPGELVYLKSDDNYVDLISIDKKRQVKKTPLRATLKSIEGQLRQHSEFVRIHRSYIINSKYFSNYSKGSNVLTLKLGEQQIELPVSRKFKPQVSALFVRPK